MRILLLLLLTQFSQASFSQEVTEETSETQAKLRYVIATDALDQITIEKLSVELSSYDHKVVSSTINQSASNITVIIEYRNFEKDLFQILERYGISINESVNYKEHI